MNAREQNPTDVLEFFETTLADQIHLTAIDPEKRSGVVARDFGKNAADAQAWALKRNSEGRNVYYTVNLVRGGLDAKPSKADIVAVRFAHVDIDPPKDAASFTDEAREAAYGRLVAASPCTINWSGNGWQALWRLSAGVTFADAELVNRGLVDALGGDVGTHDVSRLLRVPGLINWPDERKRRVGRVPRTSVIVIGDTGAVDNPDRLLAAYPIETRFKTTPELAPGAAITLSDCELLSADDLGLPSDAYLRRIIDDPDGIDRSKDTLNFACEGLRQGLTPNEIAGVLLNPENAISAHCLDQAEPARAARRAIERALEEPDVRIVARKHEQERERKLAAGQFAEPSDQTKQWTLKAMLQHCVFIEEGSQVADTTRLGYVLSQPDFKASTAASKIPIEVSGKNGSTRKIIAKVAEQWLSHPDRRTVATVTFKPGAPMITRAPSGQVALNRWSGYQFASAPPDWPARVQPLIEHIRWLFGSDAEPFLDWLAHIAQRPGELPSIAFLHIAERTGMGRNWVASVLGRVFVGYTALAFPLSLTLRSGYNGQLAGKVLAVVDEVDEGNSYRKYQMQQDLKQLVTEETRTINPKYARQHVEWNACRWLIFSNSLAALPIEDEDRRFYVVQCDQNPKSADYYNELYRLRDDPAFIASVAEYLIKRDIAQFNAGQRAPMTAAKSELLQRTRSEEERVLRDIVSRWPVDIITSAELHNLINDQRLTGASFRYALGRAKIVRVGEWRANAEGYPARPKVTAYAIRNHGLWKGANTARLREECEGKTRAEKEAKLYGENEGQF